MQREFGLADIGLSPGRQLGIGPLSITVRKGKTTPEEAARTRAWLRERSEVLTGKPAQRIVLNFVRYAKPIGQDNPIKLEVVRKQVVDLE